MELADLPRVEGMDHYNLIDWKPAGPVEPHPELLRRLNRTRSRQSSISRQRQAFITGMGTLRMSAGELALKRAYLEEWHHRVSENWF